MLYLLAEQFDFAGPMNLLRYLSFRVGGAVATALFLGLLIGPRFIALLRVRQGKGQPIRHDGPQSHLAKRGTPTMGGLMMLTALGVSALLWMELTNRYVWACLLVTAGFGLIGFLDDWAKVRKHSHAGVSGKLRLAAEFVIAALATWLIVSGNGTHLYVPFFSNVAIDLSWFYVPFGMLVIVGAGNAVNLTDGLDGLATMPVIIASVAFMLIVYLVGRIDYATYLGIPHVPGAGDLAILCGAIVGSGLAFLWFNAPPAAVFMGDTGSLALGGALGAIAVSSHHEIVLGIIGGLFVVEALVGHHPGVLLQAHRPPRVQDGPDPPPFRTARLVGAHGGDPLLDRGLRPGARRPVHVEAQVIVAEAWAGKRYAVYGLARSGAATMRALTAAGAEVVAWDERAEVREKILPGTGRGTATRSGVVGGSGAVPLHRSSSGPPPRSGEDLTLADPLTLDLAAFDAVVISPGVPLNAHPLVERARAAGTPLIGDIELFAQARAGLPDHRVVGITGTNGKSTVTALVDHLCRAAGVPSLAAGNIGEPILAAEPLPAGGIYVLELSSYQTDLTRTLDCDVAVLLNITPDHLDRYADFDAYAAAKGRLFQMQSAGHTAVIALTDAPSAAIAQAAPARVRRVAPGVCLDQSRWPALGGPHNAVNALCAIEVARVLGLPEAAIDRGLESFRGLPHRLERLRTCDGVLFVNDSKATNPEAAAPALAAFDRIHWIVGGQAKRPDLDPCRASFGHVLRAYTIGEAGGPFADLLEDEVPVSRSGTLEAAVAEAEERAGDGDTVLLSPACASFDQFADFAARGDRFRELVEALPC